MEANWYYAERGKIVGPMSAEEIASRIRQATSQSHFVWTEGMAEWTDASTVLEFSTEFQSSGHALAPIAETDTETEGVSAAKLAIVHGRRGFTRTVRVFVSSPGDAANERKRVGRVIERLNAAFAGSMLIEPVLWEERFYSAHDGFQPQITRPTDCDIVIAILRGRLGTPLPPNFTTRLPPEERLPDGNAYPSGTAYEILSAIAARRRGAELPDIFVFRYPLAPSVALDAPDRAEIEAQWDKLKSFAERVFVSEEGHFKGAYQTFSSTDDFEAKVEGALRQWFEENVLKGRAFVWPIATKGSPFRGLEPFGAKHAEVFFGRDGDRARALDRLKDAAEAGFPFLLIVGPSGAGKSSFARAGVLPWLVKPGAVMGIGVWRTVVMRPSDHPEGAIASLARHLFDGASDIPEPETGRPIALRELSEGDSATPQALGGLFSVFARGVFARPDDLEAAGRAAIAPIEKALKSVAEAERKAFGTETEQPARLLLVVDQLDELFTAGVDEAACAAFARLLDRLARTGLVWIVATLRAELYEALLKSPFARLTSPKTTGNTKWLELTFDLLPPGLTEMAEVVRGPARAAGLEWETDPESKERLDERLFHDIDRPDLLPLVQFVLDRLYEQRAIKNEKITLTFDAYRALGTLDGAIDLAAEKALSALGPTERAALPRLLRALVSAGGGEGAAALLQTPRAILAHNEASTRLVDALIEARVLVSGRDQSKISTIALAHQRVIEAWKRARQIVTDSESLLRIRDEVEEARKRWENSGRARERLLPAGRSLANAEAMATTLREELPADTLAYVQKSGRAARLRQRLTATAAVVFLAVAAVAGIFWNRAQEATHQAILAANEAEKQRLKAEGAANEARANQAASLTALSTVALSKDRPTSAAKLALAAWPRRPGNKNPVKEATLVALSAAVGKFRERKNFRIGKGVELSAVFSSNGKRVLTIAEIGGPHEDADVALSLWDPQSGTQIAALRDSNGEAMKWAKFSPDGTRVATRSQGPALLLWDAETGKKIASLQHDGKVSDFSFSLDGTRIVTTSDDQTMRLWDVAAGKQILVMHGGYLSVPSISPDGKRVVALGKEKALLWDAVTGKKIGILTSDDVLSGNSHNEPDYAVFSPDGMRLVTASAGVARIWDAATGKQLAISHWDDDGFLKRMVFSGDGKRFVTVGARDHEARLWNALTGKLIAFLEHDDEIDDISFSADGERILTQFRDHDAILWDGRTGKQVARLHHDGLVSSIAFSPNGKLALTTSEDKTARVWDADSGEQRFVVHSDYSIETASFSPDGAQIITASSDGIVRIWDIALIGEQVIVRRYDDYILSSISPDRARLVYGLMDRGELDARVLDPATGKDVAFLGGYVEPASVPDAAFSPDGKRVVIASANNTLGVWDAVTGKQLAVLRGHDNIVRGAAFSPDGALVVTASDDKTARLWDASTGKQLVILRGHEAGVSNATFSPDGTRVLTASDDKTARVWEVAAGKPILMLHQEESVAKAFFSPNGSLIVTIAASLLDTGGSTAVVWSTVTGERIHTLTLESKIVDASFSPDGRRMITDEEAGTARIWDSETGKQIFILDSDSAHGASYSMDGTRIVTTSDNTVKLWDAETGTLIIVLNDELFVESAFFMRDGKHIVSIAQFRNENRSRAVLRVRDIGKLPKGNVLQIACALLPDHELSEVEREYDLANLEPICEGDPPLPQLEADKKRSSHEDHLQSDMQKPNQQEPTHDALADSRRAAEIKTPNEMKTIPECRELLKYEKSGAVIKNTIADFQRLGSTTETCAKLANAETFIKDMMKQAVLCFKNMPNYNSNSNKRDQLLLPVQKKVDEVHNAGLGKCWK